MKGRGALVRRLRREYGLSEGEARQALDRSLNRASLVETEARILQERKRLCRPMPDLRWCETARSVRRAKTRLATLTSVALALSAG